MTSFKPRLWLLVPALLLGCGESAPPVAKVNGEAITLAVFEAEVTQVLGRYRAQGKPPGAATEQRIKESVLRRLIDDLVIAQEARRLGVALAAQELERDFQEHKQRFDTEAAYRDYLERTYGEERALRSNLARNLLRERVVEKLIGPIEVGEDEIRQHYEENRARFAKLSFEEAGPSIAGTLRTRKLNERRIAALQRLRDGARIEQLYLL